MAKNKKNLAAGVRFGPAVKAILLCGAFGLAGIGYVAQKTKIDDLGKDIRKRELHLIQLRDQNQKLRRHLADLRSPANLEESARKLKLGLSQPLPTQIVRLPEPPEKPGAEAGRQMAAQ